MKTNLFYKILVGLSFLIISQKLNGQGCNVSTSEKQALVDLYNATNGANWTNTWDLNQSVCDWFGVTVENDKVTGVRLMGNNLKGTIPNSIGNLVNLKTLGLTRNQLEGAIPTTIGNLVNLLTLYLNENKLTGAIPTSITNLTNLTDLDLSINLLESIPSSIGNLTKLTFLGLTRNNLTGTIPVSITRLRGIKSLDLGYNKLTGGIPSEIGTMTQLTRLSLYRNQLTGTIPSEIGNLVNVEILYLGENQLSGTIPSSFGNLAKLKDLSLYQAGLSGSIPTGLGTLSNLIYIDLERNELSGAIPAGFKNLQLQLLKLANNKFVFKDLEPNFNHYKSNVSNFTYKNQFSKVDEAITVTTNKNRSVTLTSNVLSSSNNNYQWYKNNTIIAGATSKDYTIASVSSTDAGTYHFTATNNVVTGITLTRNLITLSVVETCDVSVSEKQALVDLYNATNGANWTNKWDLTKPVCDWFGITVENDKVTGVRLMGNNLKGTIPNSIGNLVNLKTLGLTRNQLEGVIPTTIGNLVNLLTLYLNENKLTGAIPTSITNLTNLTDLDLSINLLESIPSSIGNLTKLTFLGLTRNNLTGAIPVSITRLRGIKSLDLGYNKLTGVIPSEIGTMIQLTRLSLYRNQLTGTIPSEIGNLVNVEILYLGENQLSGTIPSSFGNLAKLKDLSLYQAGLSGSIPTGLGTLSNLIYIDLERNELSGAIPAGFKNLQLQLLKLANNKFVFKDLEPNFNHYKSNVSNFTYKHQLSKVDETVTTLAEENKPITLTSNVLSSSSNSYQWYKNNTPITGATNKDYTIASVSSTDIGTYHFTVTNSVVSGLTFTRNPILLSIADISSPCALDVLNVEVTLIESKSIGLRWGSTDFIKNPPPASSYSIKYGLIGFTPDSSNQLGKVTFGSKVNTATINNLSPDTEYDFYVIKHCVGGGDLVAKHSFRTAREASQGGGGNNNNPVDLDVTVDDLKKIPGSSFRPMYAKKYVISGWVKEKHTNKTQVSSYKNSAIRLSTIALIGGSLTDPILVGEYSPKGSIIEGWQRIEEVFIIKTPDEGDLLPNNLVIELVNTDKTSNVTSYFDDIRIFPFNASMKSFVYDNKTKKLMAELDERNFATYYEYDKEGGLVRVKKETERGVYTIQETRSSNSKKR